MTNEEAIEILQEEHDWAQLLSYVNEALRIAIKSIEKQIPKKPKYVMDNIEHNFYECMCPNCKKYHREFYPFAYCNHCGQAIDWGEEE